MNEVRIQIPEGMCIDEENSTFECIKFKPKELTYDDIAKELFRNNPTYWITADGTIDNCTDGVKPDYSDETNSVSEKQCQRLLAINMLMNVAYYFNEIVDKDVYFEDRYYFRFAINGKVSYWHSPHPSIADLVYFKTAESIEKAIKILGEDTIKLAFSL